MLGYVSIGAKEAQPHLLPEQEMWIAVLKQAISDYAFPSAVANKWRNVVKLKALLREQARRWMFEPNEDFELVCNYAGIEPDQVREMARAAARMTPAERASARSHRTRL